MTAVLTFPLAAVQFGNLAEKIYLAAQRLTFTGFCAAAITVVFEQIVKPPADRARAAGDRRPPQSGAADAHGPALMKRLFIQIKQLEQKVVCELENDEIARLSRRLCIVPHTPENRQ